MKIISSKYVYKKHKEIVFIKHKNMKKSTVLSFLSSFSIFYWSSQYFVLIGQTNKSEQMFNFTHF